MKIDIQTAIQHALEAVDADDFDPRSLGLEFERAGDVSFDMVLRGLENGSVSDAGRVRALRMLALLTRQFCVQRKPDVVNLAIRLMEHPDPRVRSAAVIAGVFGTSTMKQIRAFDGQSLERLVERVKAALSTALRLGLSDNEARLAKQYIASDGTIGSLSED